MSRLDSCYLANGQLVRVPDVKLEPLPPKHERVPLRGYRWTCAVVNAQGQIVGWTPSVDYYEASH